MLHFLNNENELQIFINIIVMAMWIFVLVIISKGVWHKALAKYTANGG